MKSLILFLFSLPLFGASITINCGSPTDQYFSGGYSVSIPNPPAGGPAFLRSSVNGAGKSFSYRIPVDDVGPYVVSLVFVEPSNPAPGKRLFGLRINEQQVIDQINVFGIAGALKPVYRSFLAYPGEGFIYLQFLAVAKAAIVSQIVISPFTAFVTPQPQIIRVTGKSPAWQGGYFVPRPDQVSDPTLAVVYQNVVVFRNGLRQQEGVDYTVAAASVQLIIMPANGQPWPTTDKILVDYTAILPLVSPVQ